jgi:hypothetical protein
MGAIIGCVGSSFCLMVIFKPSSSILISAILVLLMIFTNSWTCLISIRLKLKFKENRLTQNWAAKVREINVANADFSQFCPKTGKFGDKMPIFCLKSPVFIIIQKICQTKKGACDTLFCLT